MGQWVEYDYDAYKRVTKMEARESGGALEQEVLFTYDTNVLGGWYLGRLSKVEYGPEVAGVKKYVEKFKYSAGGRTLKKQWDVRVPITGGAATGSLTAEWAYNEVGTLLEVTYPGGVSYEQRLDWMGRPQHLYRNGTEMEVEWANWNAAGQLTGWWRASQNSDRNYNEQFTYNARGQLVKQRSMTGYDPVTDPEVEIDYEFPALNAGRIVKRKDRFKTNVETIEEVGYTYDSLNRLVLAETTAGSDETWGLSWGFDGFGNRVSQSVTQGSGPTWSQTISTATNRVNAYTYDLNGNVTAMPGKTMAWDVLNRMESVAVSGGTEDYDYAPSGLKVRWERVAGATTTERYVFYGAGGERMEEFAATVNGSALQFASTGRDVRFGGRLIYQKGEQVFTDRLGSVVLRRESGTWKRLSSYPYGESKGAASDDDRVRFGTYERNELTNLDYARQRWYGSEAGRFLSGDPYVASAGAGDPGRWNRYGYVQGDPVNWVDPEGLDRYSSEVFLDGGVVCTTRIDPEGGREILWCVSNGLMLPSRVRSQTRRSGFVVDRLGRFGSADRYAKQLLDKRIEGFDDSNCGKLLATVGVTSEGLKNAAGNTTFYDATGASTAANYTVGGIVGTPTGISDSVNPDSTLSSFGDSSTFAYTFQGESGNAVALYGNFYREGVELPDANALGAVLDDQRNTILHEMLHAGGVTHDLLLENFSAFGLNGADDITAWLGRDCK